MRSDAPAAPAAPIDILDALLSIPDDAPLPVQEALSRLFRQPAVPAASPAASAARPGAKTSAGPAPGPKAPVRPGKIKTTQYLDADTHARLGRVRDALAGVSRKNGLGRVSKSRIVDAALRQALEAFETSGHDSWLGHALETARNEG